MTRDDDLRQTLLELHYGLLEPDEAAALRRRIASEDVAAARWRETLQSAALLAEAARVERSDIRRTSVPAALPLVDAPERTRRSAPGAHAYGSMRGARASLLALVLAASCAALLVALFVTDAPRGERRGIAAVPLPKDPAGWDLLTAAARPMPPAPERANVGETIVTAARDRRRVVLPDESVLFVDENSTVTVKGPRRVSVAAGNIYVEATTARDAWDADDAGDGQSAAGERFVVSAGDQTLTALGTKFAVTTDSAVQSTVTVAQGRVRLDDPETAIAAGRRLIVNEDRVVHVEAAPRESETLAWTRELREAARPPLVPPSDHAGGSLVAVDPDGQELSLSLRRFHVDVHIEHGFARTTIDQTYFNHETRRLEGTFYFPLPADASLSRLAMYVAGTRMEGGMVERDYARNVFEEIMYARRDPALLEWVDGTTFKMRVFPLEAREEKRILLSYTQRLPVAYSRTTYRFPAAHNLELARDFSVQLRVKDAEGQTWHSPSHDLTARREEGDLVLESAGRNVVIERDIVLELKDSSPPARTGGLQGREDAALGRAAFSSVVHEGQRYLMLRATPELPGLAARPRRNWVVLFEATGDRDPLLARVQIDAVESLLEHAEHDDTFALVVAGTRPRLFADEPLPCTPENAQAAVDFLEDVHLIGALDLQAALEACQPLLASGENPHLVHLGSGVPILGNRRTDELARHVATLTTVPALREDSSPLAAAAEGGPGGGSSPETRTSPFVPRTSNPQPHSVTYVGIPVGRRWSQSFMQTAADLTGGIVHPIHPDQDAHWRAFELVSTLNAPRLLNLNIVDHVQNWKFLNVAENLAHGEELCALARAPQDTPLPESLAVQGLLDGRPVEWTVEVTGAADGAAYLPRTWARLEIDRLLSEDAAAHKQRIIELSQQMYVMSPYTSLLVLESEEMYQQYGVDRGRKDHWALYPAPDRIPVVYEPPGEPQHAEGKPVEAPRPPHRPSEGEDDQRRIARLLNSLYVRSRPPVLVDRDWPSTPNAEPLTAAQLLDPNRGTTVLGIDYYVQQRLLGENVNGIVSDFDAPLTLRIEQTHRLGALGKLAVPETAAIDWYRRAQLDRAELPEFHFGHNRRASSIRFKSLAPPLMEPSLQTDPSAAVDIQLRLLADAGRQAFIDSPQLLVQDLRQRLDGRDAWRFDDTASAPTTDVEFDGLLDFGFAARPRLLLGDDSRSMVFAPYGRGFLSDGSDRAIRLWDVETARPGRSVLWGGRHSIVNSLNQGVQQPSPDLSFSYRDLSGLTRWDAQTPVRGVDATPWLDVNTLIVDPGRVFMETTTVPRSAEASAVVGFRIADVGLGTDPFNDSLAGGGSMADFTQLIELMMLAGRAYRAGEFMIPTEDSSVAGLPRRPQFSEDWRIFSDLVAHAPGLNTSLADVLAAIERERRGSTGSLREPGRLVERTDHIAGNDPRHGTVDDRARELIEAARGRGWHSVTLPSAEGASPLVIHCDGTGRFAYERTVSEGLRERVACDGFTLWHLYPEIGLAARREASRFHQRGIRRLVPWLVPSPDELSLAHDVRTIDEQTIALVPIRRKDHPADAAIHVHLVFAADGGLAERRYIRMRDHRELARMTLDAGGTVELKDGDGELLATWDYDVRACEPPLELRTDDLVVLPMPFQSTNRVLESAGRTLPESAEGYGDWSEDDALALIAAALAEGDNGRVLQVVRGRFFDRGDRRVGLYTLLASLAPDLWPREEFEEGAREHPQSAVLQYFAQTLPNPSEPPTGEAERAADGEPPLPPGDGLVQRMVALRALAIQWRTDEVLPTADDPHATIAQALDRIAEVRSPQLAWALLSLVADRVDAFGWKRDRPRQAAFVALADAFRRFENVPAFSWTARYARAERLASAGRLEDSRKLLRELYALTLAAGLLPPADETITAAIRESSTTRRQWRRLMRNSHDAALAAGSRTSALRLAVECARRGDRALAETLLDRAMRGLVPADDPRLALQAYAIAMGLDAPARAERMIAPLLQDRRFNDRPLAWRWAADAAHRRGDMQAAVERMDRAFDIAHDKLPEVVNVQSLREEYGELFAFYRTASDAHVTANVKLPADFAARVMRAADRWRRIDPDDTFACQAAAPVLERIGHDDAAWEYLTTPLAAKPNEAAPWRQMAEALRSDGKVELAARAYAAAFEAEPTDAELLWNHAQMLEEAGRSRAAKSLYLRLAEGEWQPRFRGLRDEARRKMTR
ncbi:MAG: FecR domain-containing protein [Planctomycetes bacterium]|nr:FecR domain-containing protein [Planctomycetota bacterium]